MALVKFRLHHVKNGTGLIRLTYLCEDGAYYLESMKERVKVSHWKKKEGRVIPSAKSAGSINRTLETHQEKVENAVRVIRSEGRLVTPEAIKGQIRGQVSDFWAFFDSIIENPPSDIGPLTIKNYKTANRQLRDYEKAKRVRIDWRMVDQNLADSITSFLREQDFNDSYIETTLNKLKALQSRAYKYGVIKKENPISVKARGVDFNAVYLNEQEIRLLYDTVNDPDFLKQQNGQDLRRYTHFFVLGTQVGRRVSDLKISPENHFVKGGVEYLNLSSMKTSSAQIVPLSKLGSEILKLYKGYIPEFSDVLMNRYIKQVAEIAKITEPVIWRGIIGGKLKEIVYSKCELISTHTMRRSWATNLLIAGADPIKVMKVGGWSSWKSFQKYIRMSAQDSAEGLAKFL